MSGLCMDNSGDGPLRVPGFGDIPIDFELNVKQCFAHGVLPNHARLLGRAACLTVVEVYMLRLIEKITEKPNWEYDVFNDAVVAEWYADALSTSKVYDQTRPDDFSDIDVDMDLVSSRTWDWCIEELRDKAKDFKQSRLLLNFNADSAVCKSNLWIPASVRDDLCRALQDLIPPSSKKSPNPFSDLVDPSLFMLVHGRTAVLNQQSRVMSEPRLTFPTTSSNANVVPAPIHPLKAYLAEYRGYLSERPYCSRTKPLYRWSNQCQWLPCEVEFTGSEPSSTEVRITSYINNLHPDNDLAYATIERLIASSLEPWNHVLIGEDTSRYPLRIHTYGYEHHDPSIKERFGDMCPSKWEYLSPGRKWSEDRWSVYLPRVKEYFALPEPGPKYEIADDEPSDPRGPDDLLGAMTPEMCSFSSTKKLKELVYMKWARLNAFKYPEAGISYSYMDWKKGLTATPIVKKRRYVHGPSGPPPTDHTYQTVCLQEKFRKKGLQIIVRISSVDLTPETPFCEGDEEYHVDGLLNEHIVATSRFYYDVQNLESRLSFQQECDLDPWDYMLNGDAMHKIFGFPYAYTFREIHDLDWPKKIQTLGSIPVKQDSFFAWSNTTRYKNESFSLKDKSLPGHQRCVILYLVDPHYRICSTRNVPAQQHDWWREAVLATETPISELPQELADIVMGKTDGWPMGLTEAVEYKDQSKKERDFAMKTQTAGIDGHNFEIPMVDGEA